MTQSLASAITSHSCPLTESQTKLLEKISSQGSMPLDHSLETKDVQRLIAEGYVRLKIVQYEWGLTFELVNSLQMFVVYTQ